MFPIDGDHLQGSTLSEIAENVLGAFSSVSIGGPLRSNATQAPITSRDVEECVMYYMARQLLDDVPLSAELWDVNDSTVQKRGPGAGRFCCPDCAEDAPDHLSGEKSIRVLVGDGTWKMSNQLPGGDMAEFKRRVQRLQQFHQAWDSRSSDRASFENLSAEEQDIGLLIGFFRSLPPFVQRRIPAILRAISPPETVAC